MLVIVLFLFGAFFSPDKEAYALKPLEFSEENPCPKNLKTEFLHEVDPKLLPPSLDQGRTGTCFAHSSYNLVYNLFRSKGGSQSEPSLLDFFSKSCNPEKSLMQGGSPEEALFELMNHSDQFLASAPYHRAPLSLLAEVQNVLGQKSRSEEKCEQVNTLLKDNLFDLAVTVSQIQSILNKKYENRTTTGALNLLLTKKADSALPIPSYNITNEDLQNGNRVQLEKLIHSQLMQESPRPVSVGLDSGDSDPHALTLVGVRNVCCSKVCSREYKIKNSWGGKSEGWVRADELVPLVRSVAYIEPCEKENCKKYILGSRPIEKMLQLESLAGLQAALADPDLEKTYSNPDLRKSVLEQANRMSLRYGRSELGAFLREKGFEQKMAQDLQWKQIHLAAASGKLDEVKKSFEAKPDSIFEKDSAGNSAADIALLRGNLKVVDTLADKNVPIQSAILLRVLMGSIGFSDKNPELTEVYAKLLKRKDFLKVGDLASYDDNPLARVADSPKVFQNLSQSPSGRRVLQSLVESDLLNQPHWEWGSPLHLTIHARNSEALNKFLNVPGIVVDYQDQNGDTPLHLAMTGKVQTSELLAILKKAPVLDLDNNAGLTPLEVGLLELQKGNLKNLALIDALLKAGAKPRIRIQGEWTDVHSYLRQYRRRRSESNLMGPLPESSGRGRSQSVHSP